MTYKVIGNRTAKNVVADNDEVIGTCIANLEEAQRIAICAQKFEGWIAAWVEESKEVPATDYPKTWTAPGKYDFAF